MPANRTTYDNVRCPYCGSDARIKRYTHYPGGKRLGSETLLSLDEKECECDWDRTDAERAWLIHVGEEQPNDRSYG